MSECAAVNPDGTLEAERDTINRLVKNRDELVKHLESQKEEINRLMGVNQHLEIDLSKSMVITELVVKGLKEITNKVSIHSSFYALEVWKLAHQALSEIERLSQC